MAYGGVAPGDRSKLLARRLQDHHQDQCDAAQLE